MTLDQVQQRYERARADHDDAAAAVAREQAALDERNTAAAARTVLRFERGEELHIEVPDALELAKAIERERTTAAVLHIAECDLTSVVESLPRDDDDNDGDNDPAPPVVAYPFAVADKPCVDVVDAQKEQREQRDHRDRDREQPPGNLNRDVHSRLLSDGSTV